MKLIVGLGNPGPKYKNTRHNVGFVVTDKLAEILKLEFLISKNNYTEYAKYENEFGKEIEILKPTTFMNKSGIAVKAISKKHNIKPENIIVITDDLDMEVGKIRLRSGGSSGGHKGIQSIINELGTNEFARLKIGIGRIPGIEADNYVTQTFTPEQKEEINNAIPETIEILKEFISK